jgi:peptide/nickel transport system substrate-binding protein
MKKYCLLIVVTFLLFSFFSVIIIGSAQDDDFAFYAYNSTPVTDWDPSVEFSNGIVSLNNVYETLLRYDPLEDEFIKVLATDYTTSSDGLTWTFYLREGVKFHDGTELNADAVKFSIDRTMEMNMGAAFIWAAVDRINVVDNYTVEFKLKYPAPLDLICSSGYAAFIMSPATVKSHPDSWLTEGNEAGSGPYKLEKYQQERGEVILTWFEDYWGGWEGNHFKKAVIKDVSEAVT